MARNRYRFPKSHHLAGSYYEAKGTPPGILVQEVQWASGAGKGVRQLPRSSVSLGMLRSLPPPARPPVPVWGTYPLLPTPSLRGWLPRMHAQASSSHDLRAPGAPSQPQLLYPRIQTSPLGAGAPVAQSAWQTLSTLLLPPWRTVDGKQVRGRALGGCGNGHTWDPEESFKVFQQLVSHHLLCPFLNRPRVFYTRYYLPSPDVQVFQGTQL